MKLISGAAGRAPMAVQGALISSVFYGNTTSTAGLCPTGNCTWPSTPTLGMCSSCTDVRSKLVTNGSTPFSVNYTLPWMNTVSNAQNTTLSLESTAESLVCPLATLRTNPQTPVSSTVDGRLVAAQFHVFGIPPSNYDYYTSNYCRGEVTRGILPPATPLNLSDISPLLVAYDCSFYFCLQTVSAETKDGTFKDALVSTWDQWKQLENQSSWYTLNGTPSIMNAGDDSVYQVDSLSFLVIGTAFDSLLNGSVSGTRHSTSAGDGPLDLTFAGPMEALGDPFMHKFWDASNSTNSMSAHAQQMANGFTAFLRTTMTASADIRYAPTIHSTKTFVHVRWAWLLYPLGQLVSGYVFLLITIWQTRRRCVQPWKSLRLPLLLSGIDDSIKEHARGGLNSRTGLEERVGKVKVWLEYNDEDHLYFRTMEELPTTQVRKLSLDSLNMPHDF
jgi:hypothetical protein